MELMTALKGRRAVREYTAREVDDATIARLIDAAVQAPSAVNEQPWTFTVVRDPHVLDRIAAEAKAHMLATLPIIVGHPKAFPKAHERRKPVVRWID